MILHKYSIKARAPESKLKNRTSKEILSKAEASKVKWRVREVTRRQLKRKSVPFCIVTAGLLFVKYNRNIAKFQAQEKGIFG